MRKAYLLLLGLMAGVAATASFAQDATVFGDKLGTIPVANTNRAQVAGTGYVTANLSGNSLTITGEFEGLTGPATGVGVYAGKLAELGATEVTVLEADAAEAGSFSGTIELDDAQQQILQDSGFYVVVQTEPNPTGEIKAWLVAGNTPNG
jgi:hypothetical protein